MLKKVLIGLLILGSIGAIIAYDKYTTIFSANVPDRLENDIILIPTHSSFGEVVDILYQKNQIIDTVSFREVAEMMNYRKPTMRPGRYRITPSWSNRSLIGHLRAGAQEPIKLVFNYGWLLEDVAGKAA